MYLTYIYIYMYMYMYIETAQSAQRMRSSWQVGETLDGIWHTGVVVYDKEYYYAKDLLDDYLSCWWSILFTFSLKLGSRALHFRSRPLPNA